MKKTEKDLLNDPNEVMIYMGGAVKDLGNGKVGGYLVRYSGHKDPDLTGDFFTDKTDFDLAEKSPVYFNHGMDHKLKLRKLGTAELRYDEFGVWAEAILEARDEYEAFLLELAKQGKLGWSSGTAGHLVERDESPDPMVRRITKWPLGLDASLTPTPAEPRNVVETLKGISMKSIDDLRSDEGHSESTAMPLRNQQSNVQKDSKGSLEAASTAAVSDESGEHVDSKISKKEKNMKKIIVNGVEVEVKEEDEAKLLASLTPEDPGEGEDEGGDEEETPVTPAPVKSGGVAFKTAPAVKKVTDLGFSEDETKSFVHWLQTGDEKAYKAAMQGQTDSEGGYAVPDDFYNKIVEKRNEVSFIRKTNALIIPTSLDKINVPAEGTAATKFVVSAEEAAYDENEPTLGNVAIEIHKMTKLIKLSEELEADEKANLQGYFKNLFGRALGLAENYYFSIGTGTNMPQGVLTGATSSAITSAGATAITAAEVIQLCGVLGDGYDDSDCGFLMKRATLFSLKGLTGNPFSFIPTPAGGDILGYPAYVCGDMPAMTAALKALLFGNFAFYAVGEREGLTVSRNPYLYQANGQIGLFAHARLGGAVLQAEAFYYMTQHA